MLPGAANPPVSSRRRVALEREVDAFVREKDRPENGPPHARRAWVLWMDMAVTELAWLRETIEDIKAGDSSSLPARTGAGPRPPTTRGGRWTPTGRSTARCWAGVPEACSAARPIPPARSRM